MITVAWWPRARALAALALTTIAGATVAGLVGLWQYASHDIWWNQTLIQANIYSRFFRVNGIFFDPNILGRYLVVGILACVALAWVRTRTGELLLLAAAAAVMAGALIVTYSRSSALMLLVGIVLLAIRALGARRALVAGAVLLVLAGGVALATSGPVRHAVTNSDRLERVSEGRFDLMRGGLTIWRDQPVAGAGLGGFQTPLRGDPDPGGAAPRARGHLPQQPDHRPQRGRRDRIRPLPGPAGGRRLGGGARIARPGRDRLGAVDARRDTGGDHGPQPPVRGLLRGSVRVGGHGRGGGPRAHGGRAAARGPAPEAAEPT